MANRGLYMISGWRGIASEAEIRDELLQLPRGSTIMHGGAKGADTIAGKIARRLGLHVKVYAPEWDVHGKHAGLVRNDYMISRSPIMLIAFCPRKMDHSSGMYTHHVTRGTGHAIGRAKKAKIPVKLVVVSDVYHTDPPSKKKGPSPGNKQSTVDMFFKKRRE